MVKIKDFIEIGFKISWTLLNMGFNGSEMFKKQLEGQDIINYAVAKMEGGDDSLEVVSLASTNATNDNAIDELLVKMASNENIDNDVEYRKWRVIYVLKHLPNDQVDYIQGLIVLGDIWATLDYPNDSPHVFQGRNNLMTPNEYYTQENYFQLLKNHREWIDKEVSQVLSGSIISNRLLKG